MPATPTTRTARRPAANARRNRDQPRREMVPGPVTARSPATRSVAVTSAAGGRVSLEVVIVAAS
jgi:hypothetical protein